jgi:hypothetical protein
MQNSNIVLVRGDDQTIGVNVYTSSGTAFNLSGYSLVFTARQTQVFSSAPLLIEATTGHISSISGISQLVFAGGDTVGMDDLSHYYDIKLISNSGLINPSGVTTTTLIYGNFNLVPQS